MRLLGITMAYNEADCIGHTVRCLGLSGHEVVLVDHGSTDGTAEIATEAARRAGFELTIGRIERRTIIEFKGLFQHISGYIGRRIKDFDWVTWLAADEILRPPEDCDLERSHIEREWNRGVRVIRPFLREFWMTEKDPSIEHEPDHVRRLRYFRPRGRPGPSCPRGWQIDLTGTMPRGLHRRTYEWPEGTKISHEEWWLDHYPIRTAAQAKRKIMKERPAKSPHYRRYWDKKCRNIVRQSRNMQRRDG